VIEMVMVLPECMPGESCPVCGWVSIASYVCVYACVCLCMCVFVVLDGWMASLFIYQYINAQWLIAVRIGSMTVRVTRDRSYKPMPNGQLSDLLPIKPTRQHDSDQTPPFIKRKERVFRHICVAPRLYKLLFNWQ
jgi:hypothetical protein